MKQFAVALALTFLATHHAFAASKQSATLSCEGLTVPIRSVYLDVTNTEGTTASGGLNSAQFLSVTTEVSEYPTLFQFAVTGKHVQRCSVLQAGQQEYQASIQMIDVVIADASLTADAKTQYATAVLNFSKIEVSSPTSAAASQSTTVMTPEERRKALADFLARVPKPSQD